MVWLSFVGFQKIQADGTFVSDLALYSEDDSFCDEGQS